MLIFRRTEVHEEITLQCPHCEYPWHAATNVVGAWWVVPVQVIAMQCYCPRCDGPPPMDVRNVTHAHYQVR